MSCFDLFGILESLNFNKSIVSLKSVQFVDAVYCLFVWGSIRTFTNIQRM